MTESNSSATGGDALEELVRRALVEWFGDESCTVEVFGHGHINHTWRVQNKGAEFVLQNLSSEVFSDPRSIAENQQRLFESAAQTQDFNYQLPQPLATRSGETLISLAARPPAGFVASAGADQEQQGAISDYWRLCPYIGDSRTLQKLSNPAQARAAGEAFGHFQRMAFNVAPDALVPVIDGFLQLDGYWASLTEAVSESGKLDEEARSLWVELERQFDGCRSLGSSAATVIHGDCKVNNLLFAAESDAVIAVLDLDTLMAAPWWLDFGDLVRSAAWNEADHFEPALYAALAQGFFSGRGGLEASELDAALRAPAHLGFMLSVRFLDDHLRGNRYFRVAQPGDNLQRAAAQLEKLQQMEKFQDFMRETLAAIASI